MVNIRLDENDNVIIRETQGDTVGKEFYNTPQQIRGGCTTLAMISALCKDNVYPTNDNANAFKLSYFRNIYNKLVQTGKSPIDLASDEW